MKDRGIGAWKGRLAALLLAMVLSAAGVACGADEEPADGSSTATRTQTNAPGDEAADATTNVPTDGRLTNDSGEVTTDYGRKRDRVAAVRTLDQLQREFRAGQMVAACGKINDFLLSQFTPRGTEAETPCPQKLEAYAAARARRGDQPQRLKLLWVRSYVREAGVWVDDAQSRRLRIQITKDLDKGWQLDLGVLARPDLLAAELVGADTYGQN